MACYLCACIFEQYDANDKQLFMYDVYNHNQNANIVQTNVKRIQIDAFPDLFLGLYCVFH